MRAVGAPLSSKKTIGLVAVAVASLALLAAGCGGGGGKALTKDEYASKLSQICKDSNAKLNALGLADMATFKAKGDEAVKIGEDTVKEFKALKAPDEVKDAAKTFTDSADQIVQDLKNAAEAAKKGDGAAFTATLTSAQNHGKANDGAATQIGATECVSG